MKSLEFGPSSPSNVKLNSSLVKFMRDCTKYVSNLHTFDKYCVWRYTIGSASVNSYLIFNKMSENATQWSFLFLQYYYNTYMSSKVRSLKDSLPKSIQHLYKYFDNPALFRGASVKTQQNVASELIITYIKIMERIILEAPEVTGKGFDVYKVASPYPGLPPFGNAFRRTSVLQLPFNSTTINPHFNFAPFISPQSDCCFFAIHLPAGSKCLFIPDEYHAYFFEREIILPFGCKFDIYNYNHGNLDYIDAGDVNIVELQNKKDIKQGWVYDIDEYKPCIYNNGACLIKKKPFNIYECNYVNP